MSLPLINLEDYNYSLPQDSIAQYPLTRRDDSKLLVYSDQQIRHEKFKNLGDYLPPNTTLIFNNTRVIPARLYFRKSTGAVIEIFLLNPVAPSSDINIAMQATSCCSWSCMIGNRKRWGSGQTLELVLSIGGTKVTLTATRSDDLVSFRWSAPELNFVDIIRNAGQIPLPPYMKRQAEQQDEHRYQTVYSKVNGAVAAPTAGLHFTDRMLSTLESQGVTKEYLTLHIGAGTFQPIKTHTVTEHPMHGEQIEVTLANINKMLEATFLVAVGTTSLRTMESLYWFGVQLLNDQGEEFKIGKLVAYENHPVKPNFRQSLLAVRSWMESRQLTRLAGYTEIFIFPPYKIKSCSGLVTNFHLPASTLILLVAAFIGKDWKRVYQQAIEHNYRFLSYGDSSLLLPGIAS